MGIKYALKINVFEKIAIERMQRVLKRAIRSMKQLHLKKKKYRRCEEENHIGYEVFPPKHRPDRY